jgi:hypothetical protein
MRRESRGTGLEGGSLLFSVVPQIWGENPCYPGKPVGKTDYTPSNGTETGLAGV